MRLALTLAYRNLVGAGLRTGLNVAVLSFALIMILFFNGMIDGWNEQASKENIKWKYGQGQLLHENYNPLDPFTIQGSHSKIPATLEDETTPILLRQGSIYPQGRMLPIIIKGIAQNQSILALPTKKLSEVNAKIPAIIGNRMATAANLKKGDQVLLRWRDKNGTFDAQNITIAHIFDTDVGTVDNGQVWIPINIMWKMIGMDKEATILIAHKDKNYKVEGWNYKSQKKLLQQLSELIAMKKTSSSIMYILLLSIALLAIFDTQVLSIFRRQKEIGTYIALGMTRWQVVGLFTVEGSMYSFFAMVLGCVYGIPLLFYLSSTGIGIPQASQEMGITVADRIYPSYGLSLIINTIILIIASATIVSFLPAKKIANMNPVLALKGKIQ